MQKTCTKNSYLVANGRPLEWNVLVLASFEHLLVDAVEADCIWIRLPRYLIVLAGQVFHATHLTSQLVDVTDLTHPTDALKIFNGMLRHSLRGGVFFFFFCGT